MISAGDHWILNTSVGTTIIPCKNDPFPYYRFMHILKRFFVTLAKVITIFFTILSLGLLVLSFAKPEWIKSGIEWI